MLSTVGIIAARRRASGGGSGDPFQFRYNTADATDATSYTFPAVPIGNANSTRRVIIWVTIAALSITITSATIGGVTATVDWDSTNTGSNRRGYFISAVVPSGTTADVIINFGGTVSRIGIGVWTIPSGSYAGVIDSRITTTGSATLTVTTVVGDYCIAGGMATGTSGSGAFTWSGSVAEQYDEQYEGTINVHSGADCVATGTTTTASYVCTPTTHSTPKALAVYR